MAETMRIRLFHPYLILSVFDNRVLFEKDLIRLSNDLRERFRCETQLLNRSRSLSVRYTDAPILLGRGEAQPSGDDIVNIFRAIPLNIQVLTNIPLVVPDSRFYVELYYPQKEVSGLEPFLLESQNVQDWHDLEVVIGWRRRPTRGTLNRVKSLLLSWQEEACSTGFGGQLLSKIPGRINTRGEEILMKVPCESAIVYPAIELYLRCLAEFRAGERPEYLRFQSSTRAR